MSNLNLEFYDFNDVEDIKLGVDLLCQITSYNEPPYFVVMQRKIWGMVVAFDGYEIENSRILKYAYLPDIYENGEKT